jgi:WD40 repeat protein
MAFVSNEVIMISNTEYSFTQNRLPFMFYNVVKRQLVEAHNRNVSEMPSRSAFVKQFALFSNNRLVAALRAEPNAPVVIYSTEDQSVVNTISWNSSQEPDIAMCIAVSPNGRYLAIGLLSGSLKVFDLAAPIKPICSIDIYPLRQGLMHGIPMQLSPAISRLSFSPDGGYLAIGGAGDFSTYKNDTPNYPTSFYASVNILRLSD